MNTNAITAMTAIIAAPAQEPAATPFVVGAACLSVLVGLGFWHARRTEVDERMLAPETVAAS